jgi:hypothetical protein
MNHRSIFMAAFINLFVGTIAARTSRSSALIRQCTQRSYRTTSHLSMSPRPNDFIDAEFVEKATPTDVRREGLRREEKKPEEDKKSGGGFLSGALNSLAKLVGQDKQSIEKRERNNEMNTAIDKIFEKSGIIGGIAARVLKSVGGAVAEMAREASKDTDAVMIAVRRRMEMDDSCTAALGDNITMGAPFTASSSSVNINGAVSKNFMYMVPAQGSRGAGQVQVRATIDGSGGRVVLQELVLQTSSGQVIRVGSSGGGGGRGGGVGKVIDVEIL